MSLEFWYMVPVSIVIATIAMASGVEGATFFAPIFLILLGLPADVAISAGLITEVFGFGSGLYAYWQKRMIDYRLGFILLAVTIPAALVGTVLSSMVSDSLLRLVLGVGLLVLGIHFVSSAKHKDQIEPTTTVIEDKRCIETRSSGVICYDKPAVWEGRLWSGIGAMFMGMVSTGLGEMNSFFLLKRSTVPAQVAIATSVFVVAVTALIASGGHITRLSQSSPEGLATVISLVTFTIPGVIIGGQIGPLVAKKVSQFALERGLGILFVLIGLVLLVQVLMTV